MTEREAAELYCRYSGAIDPVGVGHIRYLLKELDEQNRRMNADRDKEALAYSQRIMELEGQLEKVKEELENERSKSR